MVYSPTQNPTIDDNKIEIAGTGVGSFSASVFGLSPGVRYYVRAYAIQEGEPVYGGEATFTTLAIPPEITTNDVTTFTASVATLGGKITNVGEPAYIARGMCYSTSPNPTTADSRMSAPGSGTGNFSVNVTNLTTNTVYYARAYVIFANGTVYGEQVSLKQIMSHLPMK